MSMDRLWPHRAAKWKTAPPQGEDHLLDE